MIFTYEHFKPIRIIDGDTIVVQIDLGFNIYKRVHLRLAHINTPEVRGEEKFVGRLVTDVVSMVVGAAQLEKRLAGITIEDKPKFAGRAVGKLFIQPLQAGKQPVSLGTALAATGLAKLYVNGEGPKPTFSIEERDEIINRATASELADEVTKYIDTVSETP